MYPLIYSLRERENVKIKKIKGEIRFWSSLFLNMHMETYPYTAESSFAHYVVCFVAVLLTSPYFVSPIKTEVTNPLLTDSDHSQCIKDQTYNVAHNGHHNRSEASRVMMSHGDLFLNIQQIGVKNNVQTH